KEARLTLTLDSQFFAQTTGAGSTRDGRDSHERRLGAKRADGQSVTSGSMLYRQGGTTISPGANGGVGEDETLTAGVDGIVKFESDGRNRKKGSVYPEAVEA